MGDDKKRFGLFRLALFDKLKSNKYASYVIVAVLSLVIIVIFLSSCKKDTKQSKAISSLQEKVLQEESYSSIIENKLVNVLGFVKGCGAVKAMVVTKSTTISKIEMQTEEKSSSGSNAIYYSPIYEKNGSAETPFVSGYVYPEIVGVLIVAEGAKDTNVKLKIINAIVSVLAVDASKIEVLEGK